jgi:hypothetical protein
MFPNLWRLDWLHAESVSICSLFLHSGVHHLTIGVPDFPPHPTPGSFFRFLEQFTPHLDMLQLVVEDSEQEAVWEADLHTLLTVVVRVEFVRLSPK